MAEVVTLGECLVALVAEQPGPLAEVSTFSRHVAGAEANVAVGLARLGHDVAYVGKVGADGFGTAIRRRLRGEGVDVRYIRQDGTGPTGLMVRERRTLGPSQVAYYRSGSAGSRLTPADVEEAAEAGVFEGVRWLHVTGITPALSPSAREAVERAIELAHSADCMVSLDLNLRRRLWTDEQAAPVLRDLAGRADVVLGSVDEAALVTGRKADPGDSDFLAAALLALGPTVAVVKLGSLGADARTAEGERRYHPALEVPVVVDPVGAGDAFCAGFIAGWLDERGLESSLELGCACGAAAVSAIGDMTGLPGKDEIEGLLRAGFIDDVIR